MTAISRLLVHQTLVSSLKTRLAPFATDESLLHYIDKHQDIGALHFWEMDPYIILGMSDTRLPHLTDAITFLKNKGLSIVVRAAGGLGVVADKGVLNFTILLPNPDNHISIDDAYDFLLELVSTWLSDYGLTVKAKEVPRSYCPGTYDLVVNGYKVAGVAQRRFRNALAIMTYISINGDQHRRTALMQHFYACGLQGEQTAFKYPDIDPDCMRSLSDFNDRIPDLDTVKKELITHLKEQLQLNDSGILPLDLETIKTDFQKNETKLARRQVDLKE